MSREIKFRAWDKKYGWVLPGSHVNHYLFPVLELNGIGSRDGLEIMQFTGLKDKNGVDIYEGDILGKRPYGYLKSDGTKDGRYKGKEWECIEVKWGEWSDDDLCLASGYEYETDGKVAGWNITFGHQSEYDDELKNYEVIGNQYENPDLLQS